MELGLKGKTVIVTGGGSNIGRDVFLAFVREGCNVVNAELDAAQGQKVVDQAKGLRGKALLAQTDVTDNNSVQTMVKKAIDAFGQVDALVNNVGWTFNRLFIENTREEWEREIKINYLGLYQLHPGCARPLHRTQERGYRKPWLQRRPHGRVRGAV